MSTKKNKKITMPDQEGIDRLVISQAADDSAWEAPIRVKRSEHWGLANALSPFNPGPVT